MGGVIADECRHGLTAAWCSLCREQAADPEAKAQRRRDRAWRAVKREAAREDRGPTIVARFDGTCVGCGERIRAGADEIVLDGDAWVHEECAR